MATTPSQRWKAEDLLLHQSRAANKRLGIGSAGAHRFRSLRSRVQSSLPRWPKAGTDKADATGLREAQQQLGHKSVKPTEIFLRARAGEKVTPTK
jgi:integrase